MSEERDAILAQVAYWYYKNGEGLSVIAKRVDRSVSMISRMLQEARDRSLVEIHINYPLTRAADLERSIAKEFALAEVHVFSEASTVPEGERMERFGSLGAAAVREPFEKAGTIGVSWGSQVHAIVSALPSTTVRKGSRVVQTSGALGATSAEHDGARIAQKLGERLNVSAELLFAPLIVDTPHVAEVLRGSPTIGKVLDLARQADTTLISVGTPFRKTSGLRRAGYLSDDDVRELTEQGVIGDIMGYHLDRDGAVLDIELNKRIVGLHPDALKTIDNVILAATGQEKVPVIRAALRGGYVDTLLTDKQTAERLLTPSS